MVMELEEYIKIYISTSTSDLASDLDNVWVKIREHETAYRLDYITGDKIFSLFDRG